MSSNTVWMIWSSVKEISYFLIYTPHQTMWVIKTKSPIVKWQSVIPEREFIEKDPPITEQAFNMGTTFWTKGTQICVKPKNFPLHVPGSFLKPQPEICAQALSLQEVFSLWKAAVRKKSLHNSKLSIFLGFGLQMIFYSTPPRPPPPRPNQAFSLELNKRSLSEKIRENWSDLPWSTDFSAERTAISSFSVRSCFS